jgi:hypothetical protein
MGMKNWPHTPGTCRAVIWTWGPQITVCHDHITVPLQAT